MASIFDFLFKRDKNSLIAFQNSTFHPTILKDLRNRKMLLMVICLPWVEAAEVDSKFRKKYLL